MNINTTHEGRVATVTLSQRNLEQLLKALELFESDMPSMSPILTRLCEDGTLLTVLAQTNDEHYERREPGVGFDGIV